MMCCGRKPDGRAAESGAKESRASCTRVSEGAAVARETRAFGRSLLLAMFAGDGLASHWRLLRSRERFIQHGGAGLGDLALLRQGRGPDRLFVVCVCGVS